MGGRRKSSRSNKGVGSNGKFVSSLLMKELPNFDLLSASPVKVFKKKRNVSRRGPGSGSSYVPVNESIVVDSSILGKHSEVVFINTVQGQVSDDLDTIEGQVSDELETADVLVDVQVPLDVHVPIDVQLPVDVQVPIDVQVPVDIGVDNTTINSAVQNAQCEETEDFLDVDDELLNRVLNEDRNPSERNETWCRNRFNSWRKRKHMDCSKQIEEYDLRELGQILTRKLNFDPQITKDDGKFRMYTGACLPLNMPRIFGIKSTSVGYLSPRILGAYFLETCKKNGERYPTESLMNMYNSFQRILQRAQKKRIEATNLMEPIFIITEHPFFMSVNRAVNEAMLLSRNAGANKGRRKVNCLTFEDERKILNHPKHQIDTPRGLQKRVVYYCTVVFLIRGNNEMWGLMYQDFTVGIDNAGYTFVKYDERTSKNYQVNIHRFQEEMFRPAVTSYDEDVVRTWMALDKHMPDDFKSGHLLRAPLDRHTSDEWYKNQNVGLSTIRRLLKVMAATAGVSGDVTNKSGRVTAITRMSMSGVPKSTMAHITGHRSLSSLEKYDRTIEIDAQAAQFTSRNPYIVGDNSQPQHVKFDTVKDRISQRYHIDQMSLEEDIPTQIGGESNKENISNITTTSQCHVNTTSTSSKSDVILGELRRVDSTPQVNSSRDGFGSGWNNNVDGRRHVEPGSASNTTFKPAATTLNHNGSTPRLQLRPPSAQFNHGFPSFNRPYQALAMERGRKICNIQPATYSSGLGNASGRSCVPNQVPRFNPALNSPWRPNVPQQVSRNMQAQSPPPQLIVATQLDDYDRYADPEMDNALLAHLDIVESLSQLDRRNKVTKSEAQKLPGATPVIEEVVISNTKPTTRQSPGMHVDHPISRLSCAQVESTNSIESSRGIGDVIPYAAPEVTTNRTVATTDVDRELVTRRPTQSSGGVFNGVHNVHLNIMNIKDFKEFWGVLNNNDST